MSNLKCAPQTVEAFNKAVDTYRNTFSLHQLRSAYSVVVGIPTHEMNSREDTEAAIKIMGLLRQAIDIKEKEEAA